MNYKVWRNQNLSMYAANVALKVQSGTENAPNAENGTQ